ncbi:hypothetical protein [Streptomyces sp. NPDC020489]|uniref:hypothetical protein n=1 Tax=Streptomyces sp. NPDC020489 TaxID=3365077 RepID=UPI0037968A98
MTRRSYDHRDLLTAALLTEALKGRLAEPGGRVLLPTGARSGGVGFEGDEWSRRVSPAPPVVCRSAEMCGTSRLARVTGGAGVGQRLVLGGS